MGQGDVPNRGLPQHSLTIAKRGWV